jgi:hypothetical protein
MIAPIDRPPDAEVPHQPLDVEGEERTRRGDEQQEQHVLGRHPQKVANKNGPPKGDPF